MLFLRKLPRRGLDGRLHPGLRHGGGDDLDAPHGCVVVRTVRHRVRLPRAKQGAKRPVFGPDAVRKHPLEVLQRVMFLTNICNIAIPFLDNFQDIILCLHAIQPGYLYP